jgi:hypothetical protein
MATFTVAKTQRSASHVPARSELVEVRDSVGSAHSNEQTVQIPPAHDHLLLTAPIACPTVEESMTRTSLCLAALLAASVPAAADPKPPPRADAWSPAVEGLRGRLVLTPTQDTTHRPQLQIALELENTSDSAAPLAISAGSPSQMLKLTLEDEAGKEVAHDAVGGNELTLLRMTLSPAAYEYVPSGVTLLRPFALVAWDMPAKRAGKLYLRATLAPVAPKDAGPRAWKGPLELPRVALP